LEAGQKTLNQHLTVTNRRLATVRNLLWACLATGILLLAAFLWWMFRTKRHHEQIGGPDSLTREAGRERSVYSGPISSRLASSIRVVVGRLRRIGRELRPGSNLLRSGSIFAFNLVFAFVAVNVAVAPFIPHRPTFEESRAANADRWKQTYTIDLLRSLYPGLSDTEVVDKTLSKTGTGVVYEPFVQFKTEPGVGMPRTGGAGVHEVGFRLIGPAQGPWPPANDSLVIFVFGGSTTIGVGVNDAETIRAQL
jgi:hypothetical protein